MEREVYEARLNAGDMLRARSYDLPESASNISFEDFLCRLNSRTSIDLYAETKNADCRHRRVLVRFLFGSQKKLQLSSMDKEISQAIATIDGDSTSASDDLKIIFVCEKSPHKSLEGMLPDRYPNIEILLFSHLQINPTRHTMVPPHELLPLEEEAAFLKTINADKAQAKRELCRIFSKDPVARWYGYEPGRICRIIRGSEQTGRYSFYRLVIR